MNQFRLCGLTTAFSSSVVILAVVVLVVVVVVDVVVVFVVLLSLFHRSARGAIHAANPNPYPSSSLSKP